MYSVKTIAISFGIFSNCDQAVDTHNHFGAGLAVGKVKSTEVQD